MTCSNCALTVTKVFEKEGLKDVNVNITTSEVSFIAGEYEKINAAIAKTAKFGYRVQHGNSFFGFKKNNYPQR